MTNNQKKVLYRILISGVLFAVLFILEHTGKMDQLPFPWISFVLCFIPYIIIGYDVILIG